jgi:hypothetical protein
MRCIGIKKPTSYLTQNNGQTLIHSITTSHTLQKQPRLFPSCYKQLPRFPIHSSINYNPERRLSTLEQVSLQTKSTKERSQTCMFDCTIHVDRGTPRRRLMHMLCKQNDLKGQTGNCKDTKECRRRSLAVFSWRNKKGV